MSINWKIVTAASFISGGALVASQTMSLLAPVESVGRIDAAASSEQIGASASMLPDSEKVIALAPFGRQESRLAPVAATAIENESFQLVGVFYVPPSSGRAFFLLSDGSTVGVAVGDFVMPEARLVEVSDVHAVVEDAGQRYVLTLPSTLGMTSKPSGADVDKSGPMKENVDPGLEALSAIAVGADPIYGVPEKPVPSTVEEGLAQFRSALQQNPTSVLARLGLQGTSDGYVAGNQVAPVLSAVGVEPGDLIISVNGRRVGNIQDDAKLLDNVVVSGFVQIELVRNGGTIVLSRSLE